MLHAGVLKKFGLYGLIQIAVPLLPEGAREWSPYLMWLALGNILFVGFVTMAQTNLKSMVGYGSVMLFRLTAWARMCMRTYACMQYSRTHTRMDTH